ncbi:MAG TPA: haloacid dehalogenase [Anaerolineae bacterium]|nr:haloacid dehalogenase [Anaerolineae bacterium]
MTSIEQLEAITDSIQTYFDAANAARDDALQRSRLLIRVCSRAIRATHREEWDEAQKLLTKARTAAHELSHGVRDYPDLYHAGYTQDALKEYVEAELAYAFIRDLPLPAPDELEVEGNTWLNGLAEAATELRRRILDITRHGHNPESERLLGQMDDIYSLLVTFDYNDGITKGLRRRTDTLRAVLERTRGDLSTAYRQAQLQQALENLEAKLSES